VLADYFASRTFQSPFLHSKERVSAFSALWAFLSGPVYYWRKRAPIEALLFGLALVALLFVDEDSDFLGFSDSLDVGTLIWLGFALAAPMLLPACYRRKGWVEVTAGGPPDSERSLLGLITRANG
jgi:hypothetical protein